MSASACELHLIAEFDEVWSASWKLLRLGDRPSLLFSVGKEPCLVPVTGKNYKCGLVLEVLLAEDPAELPLLLAVNLSDQLQLFANGFLCPDPVILKVQDSFTLSTSSVVYHVTSYQLGMGYSFLPEGFGLLEGPG